ncbi:hypothetical protein [Enterococcus pallens]|uniref:Zn-finger containing protein n=1 Tax=Enterococcus pallens ATCC BAA-351 TaxID=1158607 RepID=R2Q406_9ENTE|nr:hypothetical protein [Enterococcus pallens]EOH90058.1 hypothetical protein UAU_03887 [Enterococcus pallens ATCC BAA-351]EOU15336.1 hypothetical protein I588_04268 [Enterococcus pallens ATCC BAA-351]OJG77890.1 hypothetical protein RV10_GL002116 [Enterococcus pallens]
MQGIWMQRLLKFYQKYAQFMRGRYGRFDTLNKTLLIIAVVFSLLGRWLPYSIGTLLSWIALGISFYRLFSKRIYPRSNENQKYVRFLEKIKKREFKIDRTYRYFNCPSCKQKMRAPRGKGKIKVTCKNCHTQFIKKV